MPSTLIILGAEGDLTSRYLMPALVELDTRGDLPDELEVIAVARHDLGTSEYVDALRETFAELDLDGESVERVLGTVRYARADATEADELGSLPVPDEGPVIVYLALPPAIFLDTFRAIAASGLGPRARLAIEKPFGEDRASARELNEVLDQCLEPGQVFRVDHFLGLPIARRLLDIRSGAILRAVWTAKHVETISLVWDETIALEGRAGYYDETGALRDMIQNHLLQLLALATMEPVAGDADVPAARLDLLRRVTVDPDRSIRARYGSGTVDGASVPAYVDEDNVDPERCTETFAQIELAISGDRWDGVQMRLRSGKAMGADRNCIIVQFRDSSDELVIDIEVETIALEIGEPTLRGVLSGGDPSAYSRVLSDLFAGDTCWFVSAAEAEEQWRIVEPVLERWAHGEPPIVEYPAGSAGPV
jgi:glucose-6-phosphate 1-dehydrogenase